jgi:hypothetical protein
MVIKNLVILKQTSNQFTTNIMGNLLYIIAVVLIILWAIGYLGYNVGGLIHILLVIALIAILFRLIQGRKLID